MYEDLKDKVAVITGASLASPDRALILIADIGDPATADQLANLATDTYGAAKAALVNLTHTTALENAWVRPCANAAHDGSAWRY